VTWFDRHAGEDARAFYDRLSVAVEQSGLFAAISAASGSVGLRRYVVQAEAREGRVRVVAVDGPTLPKGGGPPASAAWAANVSLVEAALARLRRTLPRGVEFSHVALGVVRGADEAPDLSFRFDEDVTDFRATNLPMPVGAPAPTEDPAWLRTLAAWGPRTDEVRARFNVARGDWSLTDGLLDDGQRRIPAFAVATWHPGQRRFTWLLDDPVGEEAPLVEPELTVDLAGAIELVAHATARLGGAGLFQGTLENGVLVFLAERAAR